MENNTLHNPQLQQTFAEAASTGFYLRRLRRVPALNVDYGYCLSQIEGYGRRHFPGFVIDDNNRFVYLNLVKWLYADTTMECHNPLSRDGRISKMPGDVEKGIYLAGSTGSGKSVAIEIINALSRFDNIPFYVGDEKINLYWRANLASDIHEEISRDNSKLRDYKSLRVLCIQDLGGETGEDAVYMGNRMKPLRAIIEARGERQDLMTIVTSNHSPASELMRSRYTDRGVSRLLGMTNYLVLGGKDRRTVRYKQIRSIRV